MSRSLRFWKHARHAPEARRVPVKRRPQARFRPHLESLEDRLAPATHVWSGAFSSSWLDARNWSSGGSPYGDNDAFLIFPASNVARLTSTHDGPETLLSGIRFEGPGYTVNGGPIRWASGVSSTGPGTNTIDFQSIFFDGTVLEHGFYPAAGGTLDVKSTIVPTFTTQPLYKGSAGTLILSGNNTFTCGVRLEAGTLDVGSDTALGTGTLFLAGGTLEASRLSSLSPVLYGNRLTVTRSSTVSSVGRSLNFNGDVQIFQNQTLSVVVNDGGGTFGIVVFRGILFGPGRLTKSGPGAMRLDGTSPNTYEGGTVLQEGRLSVSKDSALGQGPLVLSGGRLVGSFSSTRVTLPNPFEVSGGIIRNDTGSNDPNAGLLFSGPGTILQGATLMVEGLEGNFPGSPTRYRVVFSGPLSGPGGLTTMGGSVSEIVLTGTQANTYTGTTTVEGGILLLKKPASVTAIAGPLVIGDGEGGPKADVVSLGAANQIADSSPVRLLFTGLLKLNDFNEDLGSVQDDGYIEYGDPPTLTVGFNNLSTTFGGVINGPGLLVKVGTGTWTLTGNNTFTGDTVVNGGTLRVDGSLPGPVTVNTGATLGGTGTTGPVTLAAGAVVSPGGADPGIQRVQDLALSSGSSYVVQLNGLTAGTGYDQLDVTGTASLSGATLDASLGFNPAAGDTFVIIKNDDTDALDGTFAGLPQGAVLHIGGVAFHIYYDRGDGNNDVVLVRNVPPAIAAPGNQTAFQNVDLAISGLAVADPEDANLSVTLQVSHGTLTLGTIAGLTVGGNGTSSVSLSGSQAALNAALAGLLYGPDHNYSGLDTLTITVSDGLDITSATVAIRVKSLAEQAADLQALVKALQDAGLLNHGQANSLIVKLDLNDNHGDIGKAGAFLNHVDAFLSAGILSPAQANPLLAAGNILLTGLRRR